MKSVDPSLTRILDVLGIKKLNDLQQLAAEEGLFSSNDDLAIVSQSRTGKSFSGALQVANQLFQLKQEEKEQENLSIFITPFHASARDFYSLISKYFGWFLKPLVILEETRKAELLFRISKKNPPNIIITTPESMQKLLRNQKTREWFLQQKIKSVVLDDVHSVLFSPQRGPILYEVASFFRKKITSKPRIIVYSAQFDNPERLKDLFRLNKVIEDTKKYRVPKISVVNYETASEKRKILAELLLNLADEGTRTLVFMNTIEDINKFLNKNGNKLSQSVAYDIDLIVKERLEKIAEILEELNYNGSIYIRNGIGCDHGLMDENQCWFVEWVFRRKYLRFLLGTQTLAYGVNTPVKHVVMSSPGLDDIFRQSMMSRAVWMRRGKGQPGEVTIFSKTVKEIERFEKTFSLPQMPMDTIRGSHMSNYLLGLIGLGIFNKSDETDTYKQELKLFFKWINTERGLRRLLKANPPLVAEKKDHSLELTPLGRIAFENIISGDQIRRIVDGIRLLVAVKSKPTEFDLLLLMNHATIIERGKTRFKKELPENLQAFLEEKIQFALAPLILNTKEEKIWRKAIEYSTLIYAKIKEDLSPESIRIRKGTERLTMELRHFSNRFKAFLIGIYNYNALGDNKKTNNIVNQLIDLMESEVFKEIMMERKTGKESSLKDKDLSFVDFGEIELSIDKTLGSDLTALQKIQLIELLESVESTTSAFVELMKRSKEDPEAIEIIKTVASISKEGQVGKNLIKALVEEGVLDGSIVDQLSKQFSEGMDKLKKKFGAPAAATQVLFSIFTGNIIGASKASIDLFKPLFKKNKVDTSGFS